MKYVLNKCFGGFSLSDEALEWLMKEKGWKATTYNDDGNCKDSQASIIDSGDKRMGGRYYLRDSYYLTLRSDSELVECVETLGKKANGIHADLAVIECPMHPSDNIEIDEYDGIESLQTRPERW